MTAPGASTPATSATPTDTSGRSSGIQVTDQKQTDGASRSHSRCPSSTSPLGRRPADVRGRLRGTMICAPPLSLSEGSATYTASEGTPIEVSSHFRLHHQRDDRKRAG